MFISYFISMMGLTIALIGAAVAVVLAGIGSIIGVALVGRGGAGVVAEKPELFGKVLLMEVLPGTQGIYGFLVGFIVLLQTGVIGEIQAVTVEQGWAMFAACLPIAFAGLLSGIYQGKVGAAGLSVVAKQPQKSGNAVVMSVMVETYALLGLVVSILAVLAIQVG